ncbi:MAG: 3' terminal RNA ribose 2'-O-methyltransferase Hen1, partial [Actinomycetia bacterium]|nr:3' terminal RNA ribose 2'-O-methyltransferase Hen1 [Actinomycetes bacterium]
YVLLPVLDDAKHYWVGEAETDKLMRHAGEWLADHPARETIMQRYLAHQRRYVEDATARLLAADGADKVAEAEVSCQPPSLAVQRRAAIVAALVARQAWRVVDVGCGEGRLCADLLGDARFAEVVGTDVSAGVLARAEQVLGLDRMPQRRRDRLHLWQSSVTYRDTRLSGFDALVLAEVVEHVDPDRHEALERCVFGAAAPRIVVVTTPNVEYNAAYGLGDTALRHPDHRFEWTRAELRAWAGRVGERYGYEVEVCGVGEDDPEMGAPTQMAVFTRRED